MATRRDGDLLNEKKRVLSIDLETYSDVDLGSCGVYRYVEGDFHILLFAYAFDDEEVSVVDLACGKNCRRKFGMLCLTLISSRQPGTPSLNGPACQSSLVPGCPRTPGNARWFGRLLCRFR